jgi:hypothetical protein
MEPPDYRASLVSLAQQELRESQDSEALPVYRA